MRSSWKPAIYSNDSFSSFNKNKALKVFRCFRFCPSLVHNGFSFFVHNGKEFKLLAVKNDFITFRAGSFVFTKALGKRIHLKKK